MLAHHHTVQRGVHRCCGNGGSFEEKATCVLRACITPTPCIPGARVPTPQIGYGTARCDDFAEAQRSVLHCMWKPWDSEFAKPTCNRVLQRASTAFSFHAKLARAAAGNRSSSCAWLFLRPDKLTRCGVSRKQRKALVDRCAGGCGNYNVLPATSTTSHLGLHAEATPMPTAIHPSSYRR
jgi:hypothetical protein